MNKQMINMLMLKIKNLEDNQSKLLSRLNNKNEEISKNKFYYFNLRVLKENAKQIEDEKDDNEDMEDSKDLEDGSDKDVSVKDNKIHHTHEKDDFDDEKEKDDDDHKEHNSDDNDDEKSDQHHHNHHLKLDIPESNVVPLMPKDNFDTDESTTLSKNHSESSINAIKLRKITKRSKRKPEVRRTLNKINFKRPRS